MVDVVLETHDFWGLVFPGRQISWESASSNLQLTEFASRLEDQEEDQEYDFERNQIDLKLGIRLLSREIVGSKSTDIALNPLFTDFKARLEQSACYLRWKY